jgi:hypothetical protein
LANKTNAKVKAKAKTKDQPQRKQKADCESLKAAIKRAKGKHARGKALGAAAKAGCFRRGKKGKKHHEKEAEEEE